MSTIKVTNINPPTAGDAVNLNGLAYPTAGPLSNRNLIINGAMQVEQRSSNASTGVGYVTLDRWYFERGAGVQQVSQQTLSSGDPYDEGFRSFARTLNFTVSTNTNNFRRIYQRIEAQNLAESGWNYSSATSYITLSFWARASVAVSYTHLTLPTTSRV